MSKRYSLARDLKYKMFDTKSSLERDLPYSALPLAYLRQREFLVLSRQRFSLLSALAPAPPSNVAQVGYGEQQHD